MAGPYRPHGFQEQFFAALEAVFDTDTKPAAAEGVSIVESSFEPDEVIIRSPEKTGNRLPPDHYKGSRSAKATVSFLVKPAAVGSVPNGAAILEAALSAKTVVGGTSVEYAHEDTPVVKTLRLHRGAGNSLMESAYGAVVEQLEFDIKQNEVPKVTAQIAAARLARAKAAVLTAGGALGTGQVSVAAGQGVRFDKGSTVRFLKAGGAAEDNGGLGYLVTSDDADDVTFSPVLVSAVAIADEIFAFTPTPTLVGAAVAAVNHDISFDGTSMPFTDGKVTYKTGHRLVTEANSDHPTFAATGEAEVTAEFNVNYEEGDGLGELLSTEWSGLYESFVARAGENTAAKRMKLNIANAMVSCAPVKLPSGQGTSGTSVIKVSGKAAFNVLFD